MKKHKYTLGLMIALFLLNGCQKEKNPVAPAPTVNVALIGEVKALHGESFSVAYQKLSGDERHYFWKDRFETNMSSGQFNGMQKAHLQVLHDDLKSEFFNDRSKQSAFLNSVREKWIPKAKKLFSSRELNTILTLNPEKTLNLMGGKETCNCGVENTFGTNDCGDQPTTRSCVLLPYPGCEENSSGCGFFGWESCDGACRG